GAPSDLPATSAVVHATRHEVFDLAGRTSFGQTAALIRRCRLFAGNDSAALHLAAAVGTPFAGIFGPSDPVRHRPMGKGEVVAPALPPGAYRNGFANVDCIAAVSVGEVLAACLRLWPNSETMPARGRQG
ncbi:MAG: glycosyltransferase family 9 protein, partial [Chloroflexota bacterium]